MPDLGGLAASLTEIEADYNVYKVGSQYYAKAKTGTIISNSVFAALMWNVNNNLSTGGSVVIKAGTYSIDGNIQLTNSINIRGEGIGKTILKRAGTYTDFLIWVSADKCTLSDFTFDGSYPTITVSTTAEIRIDGDDAHVERVEMKNFKEHAIISYSANLYVNNYIAKGNDVALTSPDGLWADGSTTQNTYITNSKFTGCYYNGVFLGGRSVVANCYFDNNSVPAGGQIAYGNNATFSIIEHNIIINGKGTATDGGSAIECSHQGTTGGDWIITGNYISNQPMWGIDANGSTIAPNSLVIKDNIVRNCGRDGILIHEGVLNFVIEGNLCYDDQGTPTQDYGIIISPGTGNDRYIIRNNICWNNVVSQITDSGTGTNKEVTGNIPFSANVGRNAAGATVVTDSAQTLTGKTLSSNTNFGIMTDPTAKRIGWFEPAGGTTATTVGSVGGAMGSHVPTGPGTNAVVWDTTEGLIANLLTTTTINQNAGILSPTGAAFCRTLFGGKVKARFKVDAVASAVSRVYFGVIGASAIPISDTPMASGVPGVLFGFASADTVYRVYHNDAAGAAVNDAFTGSIAKNTSFHDIEINWAAGATSVNVIFDGTTMNIATAIPATTDNLWFHCTVQNASAAIRTASYKGVWVELDK